ncbi:MAG: pyridoxal kinase PdxY [Roseitalea sp.]|nr:pyridoxal kinase PdxY [Roseitalea sp.]MBO6722579.1 pyridoxal kinase PdxY [Roseitalea sp.]MBO6745132.1 pyridoxal kinase PdxY [Roseitalea sp.]
MRSGGQPGSVAVISSHVARGAVGNRAAVFAIETLGHPVIAVPTVLLPWHPGHGPATRIVQEDKLFAGFMADLAHGPFAGEIDAVLSGYLGDAGQAEAIAASVAALRAARPDLVYACDPVIGDESGLYVPETTARAIAGTLVPKADLATPNRFELAWLSGRLLDDNDALIDAARALGTPVVLVTSAFATRPGMTGNLLVLPQTAHLAEHAAIDRAPNGTGDLTAALFLAHLVNGCTYPDALRRATASVHDVLTRTRARGADELTLAADAALLSEPVSDIPVRQVGRQSEDTTTGGRAT